MHTGTERQNGEENEQGQTNPPNQPAMGILDGEKGEK